MQKFQGNPRGGKFQNKKNSGPKANDYITADPVRLIDKNGDMAGVTPLRQALSMASDAGMDLVEVAPNAEPPVCKIMDLGKYLYEEQKKKKEAKKKQKIVHLKEIKLRPNTDPHDLEYRIKHAVEFLEAGDKVKFSMKFRGREMAHKDIGRERMQSIIEQLEEHGKVDQNLKMEGGQMTMTLAPVK